LGGKWTLPGSSREEPECAPKPPFYCDILWPDEPGSTRIKALREFLTQEAALSAAEPG
jgi:hypothetical protein